MVTSIQRKARPITLVATELEPPAPGLKPCCELETSRTKRSTRQVENTQPPVSNRSQVFAASKHSSCRRRRVSRQKSSDVRPLDVPTFSDGYAYCPPQLLTRRPARTPLQEGLERCRERHLHSRFDEWPNLRAPRHAVDYILQLVFYRVGEHRRAFRNAARRQSRPFASAIGSPELHTQRTSAPS